MGRVQIWLIALFAMFAIGAMGCGKASVEKVCEKFAEADEMEECIMEIGEEVEACANKDDVLKCMVDAADENGAESCFEQCETGEEGEEGEEAAE